MKYLYTLLLGILISWVIQAQNGVLKGKVTASDNTAAPYVNILLEGTAKGATTDTEGNYEMRDIVPGKYMLTASFIGLEKKRLQVEIQPGQVVVLDFSLEVSAAELQEVVVSATANRYQTNTASPTLRMATPLLEAPQNIQVVTKELLNDQQVTSMSDGVIRNVSGAVRIEHWADLYTNISSRGGQVQAFRNGFNVVNSYWGPLTEDMSFVERIEFVKGPAGFMLANGDPSGLYNVVTKKPTGQTKGEVNFTMGSFDLYRSALDLDGKLDKSGKLLYRFNASAQNRKSHRPNEYNNRYAIAPVIAYQLDENTRFTLEYTYQGAKMSDVGSYYVFSTENFGVLPRDFTALPGGMPATNIQDHSVFAQFQHNINPGWQITGQLARFDYKQQGTSMWPASVNPDGTMLRAVSSWDAKSAMTMGQAFLNGNFFTGEVQHRLLAGIDMANKQYFADWGQYHLLDSVGGFFDTKNPNLGVPVNGYPDFDFSTPLEERAQAGGGTIDQRYNAFYLQDELGFFDNFIRLTLAGRYTYIKQSEWGGNPYDASHFTPRIGLSVSLSDQASVYGVYDQAFIPQSGRLANGGSVKPITGNNVEFGLKKAWGAGKWNTTLAVYRILKNNELTADPNSPPSSGLSVVLGEKTSKGIELDIRGTLFEGLNLIANYAFTDSKVTKVTEGVTSVEEGDIVPGFAKHTFNSWLTYKITRGAMSGFGVSAGIMAQMDRSTFWDPAPQGFALPDYFKVDGGLFWEKDHFRITANVFNVLDEYLYSGSYYSWLNAFYWQTEPGRNFRMSLGYRF